ncbi:MAG TPA: TetR family transcriptional regulator [Gaiellales bacterium]|jgi:AcrR family transcriptional regulator|nr:TetR family transcriptional regulator [Gaiellales bacterium]
MPDDLGLRAVKKRETRRLLGEAAWELFAARGFDNVTVAEIARAAMVSEKTVFNYFPTKEDLFFTRLEEFAERLVEAVRDREPGEAALVAVRRYLLRSQGLLAAAASGDAAALDRLRTVNRVITESRALQARERQALADAATALAGELASEPGVGEVQAHVAANALIGVHRALIDHTRARILNGAEPAAVAAEVKTLGRRAFVLLADGLGDFAIAGRRRRRSSSTPPSDRPA